MRRSVHVLNYQRGGWAPGSKHQKHMTMNPTTYMYRFPGPHGPGPYTMKYWWTLGSFPTGLDVPFRLNEFLATYKQQHVPVEVEEWLSCFLRDPVESLQEATKKLRRLLEACPEPEATRGYSSPEHTVQAFLEPLRDFEEQLGVKIPPVAVRAALGHATLREKLMDDLFDYSEAVETCGSTPHRRLARSSFDEPQLEPAGAQVDSRASLERESEISAEFGAAIGIFTTVPESTSDDELKLIRLLTTLAEGCALKNRFDDSYSLLSSSLLFAHDEESQSAIHSNAAAAALLDGHFDDAAFHGREAALLIAEPKKFPKAAARGFQLWATATAFQDDFDLSEGIMNDALALLPEDNELAAVKTNISELKAQRVRGAHPGIKRSQMLLSQRRRGVINGSGKSFDNEFDWAVFKNKLYPAKMNPTTNEMGSVFRRVGDLGGAISTSRSTERL